MFGVFIQGWFIMIHLIFCNISEYSCDTYPRPNHDMTGLFKLWRMLDALTSGVPTQFLSTVNQPTFSTWPNYTTRRGFWTTALALCVFLSVYFLKFATFVHDCSLSCGPSMREVVLAPPVKKHIIIIYWILILSDLSDLLADPGLA